ncbi:hypothetical protein IFO70_37060 [Phormidium tenue FACHB-886]|nr:hypothetical protein [Phormidium tenue FACHB-886]
MSGRSPFAQTVLFAIAWFRRGDRKLQFLNIKDQWELMLGYGNAIPQQD